VHHPAAVVIAAALTVSKLALYAGSALIAVAGLLKFKSQKLGGTFSRRECRRAA
jgi:hypothetical protein